MKKFLLMLALLLLISFSVTAGGSGDTTHIDYDGVSATATSDTKIGTEIITSWSWDNGSSKEIVSTHRLNKTVTVQSEFSVSGSIQSAVSTEVSETRSVTLEIETGTEFSATIPAMGTYSVKVHPELQRYSVVYKKTVVKGNERTVTYHTTSVWVPVGDHIKIEEL